MTCLRHNNLVLCKSVKFNRLSSVAAEERHTSGILIERTRDTKEPLSSDHYEALVLRYLHRLCWMKRLNQGVKWKQRLCHKLPDWLMLRIRLNKARAGALGHDWELVRLWDKDNTNKKGRRQSIGGQPVRCGVVVLIIIHPLNKSNDLFQLKMTRRGFKDKCLTPWINGCLTGCIKKHCPTETHFSSLPEYLVHHQIWDHIRIKVAHHIIIPSATPTPYTLSMYPIFCWSDVN